MNIAIIGTGYVGLVTGACFAEMGHTIFCVDIDEKKIGKLNQGICPIYEPGLEEMIQRNAAEERLSFTSSYEKALSNAEIAFIAVPTPSRADGSCDLSFVVKAAEEIAIHLESDMIIVIKSTVPVGTSRVVEKKMKEKLHALNKPYSIEIASNPEFLKEGCAITDCLKPSRVIIGVNRVETAKILKELYAPFMINHNRIIEMDPLSAELTKYTANAMLATRISFMNEIAALCEKTGANINHVRVGIGSDSRIGYDFLYPGVGWGGSCFPKDIQALMNQAEMLGCDTPILEAVDAVNRHQKRVLFKKMQAYFEDKGGLSGKTVAIWGLSFKPNTDDLREAPSLELIKDLLEASVNIRVFDPVAMSNAKKLLPKEENIQFCQDHYEAAKNADAVALVTEWKQFRSLNLKKLSSLMRNKAFFDGRNQYAPEQFQAMQFDYFGIGIPPVLQEEGVLL